VDACLYIAVRNLLSMISMGSTRVNVPELYRKRKVAKQSLPKYECIGYPVG
jgi:hypothetical protein